jgi:hypothetical protein
VIVLTLTVLQSELVEWPADFAEHTDYPPAVQRKLLRENAEELLDL